MSEPREPQERKEPWRWRDRNNPNPSPFEKSRAVELRYSTVLRGVARAIGELIDGFGDPVGDPAALERIEAALAQYAETLAPWAAAVGERMVNEANQADAQAWNRLARGMSRTLRAELMGAPTGQAMTESLARQVALITSLPLEAAQRVHTLTIEGVTQGRRAADIAKEIARSGQVTAARATLIARTEVSRTATELTKARAEHVGSEGYIWETSRDSDVRPSHRKMQGRYVAWTHPPTLDGMTGHAGCLPNCRCWTRVLVPGLGHNQGPAFAEG